VKSKSHSVPRQGKTEHKVLLRTQVRLVCDDVCRFQQGQQSRVARFRHDLEIVVSWLAPIKLLAGDHVTGDGARRQSGRARSLVRSRQKPAWEMFCHPVSEGSRRPSKVVATATASELV